MEFRSRFCLALCIAIALEVPHYALKIHGRRFGLQLTGEKHKNRFGQLASMMGTNLGLTNEKMARWLIDVGVSNTRRLIVSLPME